MKFVCFAIFLLSLIIISTEFAIRKPSVRKLVRHKRHSDQIPVIIEIDKDHFLRKNLVRANSGHKTLTHKALTNEDREDENTQLGLIEHHGEKHVQKYNEETSRQETSAKINEESKHNVQKPTGEPHSGQKVRFEIDIKAPEEDYSLKKNAELSKQKIPIELKKVEKNLQKPVKDVNVKNNEEALRKKTLVKVKKEEKSDISKPTNHENLEQNVHSDVLKGNKEEILKEKSSSEKRDEDVKKITKDEKFEQQIHFEIPLKVHPVQDSAENSKKTLKQKGSELKKEEVVVLKPSKQNNLLENIWFGVHLRENNEQESPSKDEEETLKQKIKLELKKEKIDVGKPSKEENFELIEVPLKEHHEQEDFPKNNEESIKQTSSGEVKKEEKDEAQEPAKNENHEPNIHQKVPLKEHHKPEEFMKNNEEKLKPKPSVEVKYEENDEVQKPAKDENPEPPIQQKIPLKEHNNEENLKPKPSLELKEEEKDIVQKPVKDENPEPHVQQEAPLREHDEHEDVTKKKEENLKPQPSVEVKKEEKDVLQTTELKPSLEIEKEKNDEVQESVKDENNESHVHLEIPLKEDHKQDVLTQDNRENLKPKPSADVKEEEKDEDGPKTDEETLKPKPSAEEKGMVQAPAKEKISKPHVHQEVPLKEHHKKEDIMKHEKENLKPKPSAEVEKEGIQKPIKVEQPEDQELPLKEPQEQEYLSEDNKDTLKVTVSVEVKKQEKDKVQKPIKVENFEQHAHLEIPLKDHHEYKHPPKDNEEILVVHKMPLKEDALHETIKEEHLKLTVVNKEPKHEAKKPVNEESKQQIRSNVPAGKHEERYQCEEYLKRKPLETNEAPKRVAQESLETGENNVKNVSVPMPLKNIQEEYSPIQQENLKKESSAPEVKGLPLPPAIQGAENVEAKDGYFVGGHPGKVHDLVYQNQHFGYNNYIAESNQHIGEQNKVDQGNIYQKNTHGHHHHPHEIKESIPSGIYENEEPEEAATEMVDTFFRRK